MKFVFTLLILSIMLAVIPTIATAVPCPPPSGPDNGLNLCYPEAGGFSLKFDMKIEQIVAWLYTFFVMISGLAAFVMIVWGGVQWMSSQGNPTATGDAKDKIQKALLGLLLVLASFLILQIINPELTLLEEPALIPLPGAAPGAIDALPAGAPSGVYLCARDACAGNEYLLVGSSPGLIGSLGAWDDRATALAIRGPYDVLLYTESNGNGRVICFVDSIPDLERYTAGPLLSNGWDNDVSGLKIMQEGECKIPGITFLTEQTFAEHNIEGVLLCRDASCSRTTSGDFFVTNASLDNLRNVERIGGGESWNDKVAALKIIGPYVVLLYEHARDQDRGGKVICLASRGVVRSLNEHEILPGNTWEDDVSSIELLGVDACPFGREGLTFQDRSALFAAP